MGAGVLGNLHRIMSAGDYEPVVSAADYYASPGAARDVLRDIGWHVNEGRADWWSLPACLGDAALTIYSASR